MVPQHFGVFPEDHNPDPDPEETLARLNSFIVALVGRKARSSSNFARPEVFDLEIDEMAQRVRYKFWQALSVRHIENPQAYLRIIVRNEFNDLSRKRKQPLPLLTTDDGEWYLGDAEKLEEPRMADPADEYQESEGMEELMDSAAAALARLSPRQQQAMICELNEKIGATLQLLSALRKHQVDVEIVDWPKNEADRKLLKAVLPAARKKMEQYIGVRQSVQAQWDVPDVDQLPRLCFASENEPPSPDQPDTGLPVEGVNEVEELEASVDKLREPYRTAVRLHYVEKNTYPQIASKLNLPKGTIKSHVSRGMKVLSEILERKDEEPDAENVKNFAEILAHLDSLAEPYQTAVRLHYVEKHTYPQMADELNLPKGTVKSHVCRGMKMLRQSA